MEYCWHGLAGRFLEVEHALLACVVLVGLVEFEPVVVFRRDVAVYQL
jgi:hypothetical protein